ncbi:MAG TPA: hypothetical protein VLF95_04680 [Vicinamibacteria bacterium]|nr:hypothetical protein [Vicinamibacteria bacterium]
MDALVTGLVLVGGGTAALALATHSARDLASWLRHAFRRPLPGEAGRCARAFWASASRNAVLLGALGAAFGLAAFLGSGRGPSALAEQLGVQVLGPPILGLVAATLCALPAGRRAAPSVEAEPPPASRALGRWPRVETALGYAAFLVLLAVVFPASGAEPSLRPVDLLLHGPAWLTVAAGAVVVALYLGEPGRGRSLTLGLAAAGGTGALLGLLQAFHGMAVVKIETVAGGLVFSLSAAVAALVGLGAVGFPIEDRAVAREEAEPSRLVGWGAALAALLLVAIACVMVMTPMTAPR